MRKRSFPALAVVVLLGLTAFGLHRAFATVQTDCPGNVCSRTVTVGGQSVTYWWTQNQATTNSSIKVRFRSGPYAASAQPVRFKVTASKPFTSYASLKDPSATSTLPTTQTVDVADTWIERSVTSVSAGTTFDFVQELKYDTLTAGTVDLTIDIVQYGASQTITQATVADQRVQVDATAPTNRDEGFALPAPPYPVGYLNCQDGVDNDLDYVRDCADADCSGKTIQNSPLRVCEQPETTCNDGLDNDGNGKADCADPLCNGKPGNPAGDKFCGAENGGTNHANCADGFDNDGNGKYDCKDDAPGTGCWRSGFQDCGVNETTPSANDAGMTADQLCTDNKDNDRDTDYSETLDTDPATGIDAKDFDCSCVDHPSPGDDSTACSLKRHIPISERLRWDAGSTSFVDAPSQCSDGVDNDLDGKKDCADLDCLAAPGCAQYEAWLPPAALDPNGVTSPASYFNYCSDTKDNDGNGLVDGADAACKNVFGECAPADSVGLVSTENFNLYSCADGLDNDLNGATDCSDAVCRSNAKFGRKGCTSGSTCLGATPQTEVPSTDAAVCAPTENTDALCGDGFDNDADGLVDCADPGCAGHQHGLAIGSGLTPYSCGTEASNCSDGVDNDGNGLIDCLDSACQNGTQCAQRPPTGWTTASCITVPNTTAPVSITGSGPTNVSHNDRLHIGDPYKIQFTGGGTYTSLTLVIGDNVNMANKFPFNATTCVLSGPSASQLTYVSPNANVGTLFEQAGQTINGLDATLTCTGSASLIGPPPQNYTVSVVSNGSNGVEFGETTLSVQVYETTPPVLSPTSPAPTPGPAVDVEGVVAGKVNIPIGGTVHFQAKPGDPAPSSGICSCDFSIGGVGSTSSDGNCTVTKTFANDVAALSVSASARDGADNRSTTSTPQTVTINVLPSVNQNLVLTTSKSTYKSSDALAFSTTFQTDTLSTFAGPCRMYVYDMNWSGSEATTVSWAPAGIGTNLLTCAGTYTIPPALSPGRYFAFVEATDGPGGDVVRSNVQPFLKCDPGNVGTGDCKDADLDNDGVPEGRYTPSQTAGVSPAGPTYPGPTPRACDNCINLANPNQADVNANGIGDACEASQVGRCKYKQCSSTLAACATDADCEAIQAGTRCIVVDQQAGSVNCSVDSDCNPPTTANGGTCSLDWGLCGPGPGGDEGNYCFNNEDCSGGSCVALVKPFLQTVGGQVFANGQVAGQETPPIYNATYCVQANGSISNFTSESGCSLSGVSSADIPQSTNNYVGTFGVLDVNGILNGKYGPLQSSAIPSTLGGQIFKYDPGTQTGLTIGSPITFMNATGSARGNGLIVVKGDLVVNADVSYQDVNPSDLKNLASVGWIVLKSPTCNPSAPLPNGCGNVIIDPAVGSFVGAVFAEGTIDTGDGSAQLNATGMWVAKDFTFGRQYASRTAGSEKVTFDSRVILNPPPGMTDVTRSLPGFKSIPAQ